MPALPGPTRAGIQSESMIHVCQRVHKRTRRKAGGHRGVERTEKNERKGRKFGGSSRRIWPVLYPSPSTSPPGLRNPLNFERNPCGVKKGREGNTLRTR